MSKLNQPSPASLSQQERATLRWVLWVVAACMGGVALLLMGLGLVLPNHWNVTREALVHAPAAEVHALVSDWRAWETWAKDPGDDPTLQYSYSGPETGVGAVRTFVGKYAGTGRSEIVKSDLATGAAFVSAVRSETNNAHSSITYRPQGGSTLVVWHDQGKIDSFFGVFLRANVEDELTKYLDGSLQRLKSQAEENASQTGQTPTP